MADPQATDIELGWIAGIIDGEGWLGVSLNTEKWCREGKFTRSKTVKVEIKVNNCDPAIVEKTAIIMRKLGVNPYLRHGDQKGVKNVVYEVAVKNMKAVEIVLSSIRDYLTGTKQKRADLILRFIHLRRENPGIPNPSYANGKRGWQGPRTIRPYTVEELELVEQCRALQARSGAPETAREIAAATLREMKQRVAHGDLYVGCERYSPALGESQGVTPF